MMQVSSAHTHRNHKLRTISPRIHSLDRRHLILPAICLNFPSASSSLLVSDIQQSLNETKVCAVYCVSYSTMCRHIYAFDSLITRYSHTPCGHSQVRSNFNMHHAVNYLGFLVNFLLS